MLPRIRSREPPPPFGRTDAAAILSLIVVATAAFWRTLPSYFLSDDFVLLKHARSFHGAFRPLSTTGGDGFFRPVGYLSLAFTSPWAGSSPALWHATALGLHITNAVLVFVLAGTLGRSRLAAFFTAALFAIHGTRPEVALWVAGRFDLLSTFFVVCGLLFFIRSQTEILPFGYVYASASLMCMTLGILSKESAFIFPVLVAVLMFSAETVSWRRIAGLVPFFFVAAVLFAYRWWFVGGIGGYRDVLTGQPQVLTLGAIQVLKALTLRIWAVLFFPLNWSREPGRALAVLMTAYVLALLRLAVVRVNRAKVMFPLAFVLITVLPPLHLLLIGPDLGKSRLLYLPSIGFSLMLACGVDGLKGGSRWAIPGVLLAFHFSVLQHNLDSWEYASARAKLACVATVKCMGPGTQNVVVPGLPGALRGVPFFSNGFPEALALQRDFQSMPVGISGSASGGRAGTCLLTWDSTRDELRVVY